MRGQQINRGSYVGLVVVSLAALMTVLPTAVRAVLTGQMATLEPDEGTGGAHIFQLSLAALVPIGFLFFATADWKQPLRPVGWLTLPGVAVVLALGILYYFEHYLLGGY